MKTQDAPRVSAGPVLASGAALVVALVALLPGRGEAVPAFARQYGVKCQTCHTPIPPRLNNVGVTFKRMGYRMPDADDDGKLILKEKPSRGAFDDLSVIADFRAENEKEEPTAFMLDEVEAMGGGAIGKHLSYGVQVAWEGEFELEAAEGQVLLGRPTANFTARAGLLQPLLWDKGGHQRLTVAQPLLFTQRVPAGGFAGARLREMQTGLEVGVNFNHLAAEGGNLRSTFLSLGLFNGLMQEMGELTTMEENNDFKDVLLQGAQLWGDSNSVSALYYRGKATEFEESFENRIERFALVGNYRFPKAKTDLVAGFGFGRDKSTEPGIGTVKSRGWFAEVDQGIGQRTVAALRWDRFEPDTGDDDEVVSGPTLSATHQLFDHLFLSLEYRGLREGTEERERELVGRVLVTY